MIKVILLTNNQVLISQIEEVSADIGEPDCKLINPYAITTDAGSNQTLEPFMMDLTIQNTFMVSSEKILTIADPVSTLIEKYQNVIS
jgi:hypothetical protein